MAMGLLGVGGLIGPKRNTAVKEMPYESGMDPIHDARKRFDVRFHLVAIAFLVFDVELVFLYPWATAVKGVGMVAFIEIIVFMFILFMGLIYAYRKGSLKWM